MCCQCPLIVCATKGYLLSVSVWVLFCYVKCQSTVFQICTNSYAKIVQPDLRKKLLIFSHSWTFTNVLNLRRHLCLFLFVTTLEVRAKKSYLHPHVGARKNGKLRVQLHVHMLRSIVPPFKQTAPPQSEMTTMTADENYRNLNLSYRS